MAAAASQLVYRWAHIPGIVVPLHAFLAAGVCFACLHMFNWKRSVLWSLPYYLVAAAIGQLVPASLILPVLLFLVWRACQAYEHRLTSGRAQSRKVEALYLRTVEALAIAIEARDQPTSRHTRRVGYYAQQMSLELRLTPAERDALRVASLLYDIGELAVPEHIILKPGRLTPEEFEKVKTHPEVGAGIIEQVQFPYPVAPIVRGHHERWDGHGYPQGLAGEQIPIGARILAIADAVDSLASPRHHREAIPLAAAVQKVTSEGGSAFDPQLTALLAKHWTKWEKLVAKGPSSGLESIVEAQREAELLRYITGRLSGSIDLTIAYEAASQGLLRLIPFDALVVWLERKGNLVARHADGACAAQLIPLKIRLGTGVSGRVAEFGKLVLNGDATRENESGSLSPLVSPLAWALSAPLNGEQVCGALTLYRSKSLKGLQKRGASPQEGFTADEARLISTIAPLLSSAIVKALKYRDVKDRAGIDSLTGLPNSSALSVRLSALSGPCAIVLCDLDGFKQVNDRFGHLTGNRLLTAAAKGFRRACRSEDFVARMGGDEFVLVLNPRRTEGLAQEIESRLAQFRAMVRAVGTEITSSDLLDASFGVAFYPDDSKSPEELLKIADQRMYSCKEQHKSGVLALDRGIRAAESLIAAPAQFKPDEIGTD